MTAFRIGLALGWLLLLGYTGIVGASWGFNLLPIFFGDIASLTWPGQFNLDFMLLLSLSGLWAAWRGKFSASSILWGALITVGGALVLLPYLLYLSFAVQGNASKILLGERSAI